MSRWANRMRTRLRLGVCLSAVAVMLMSSLAPERVAAQVAETAQVPATFNKPLALRERSVTFAVPLVWRGAPRGDVTVQIAPEGAISIEARALRSELRPLLNDIGIRDLDAAIAGAAYVAPPVLAEAGITIIFDQSRLELRVDRIDTARLKVESLDEAPPEGDQLGVTAQPSAFSAYLNSNISFLYRDGEGIVRPDVFWLAAARMGNVVVEGEAGLTEAFGNYRFFRQGVRAIYDEPAKYRRWVAGDLRLAGSPIAQFPQMGGIALQKSRRTFDPSVSYRALGGQRILVDTPSNVDVIVNGALFRSLDLQPGTYDLSSLPVEAGANDIQLIIRDASGRQTVTRLDMFFDPPDLPAGEDEYTLSFGAVSEDFSFSPRYNGSLAAVGNYRRALSGAMLVGGSVQLSQPLQLFSGEMRFVPGVFPGSVELEGAISTGRGFGVAGRAGYRWFGGGRVSRDSVSATVDYQSGKFATLSDFNNFRLERLAANLTYSRALTQSMSANVGATYSRVARFNAQGSIFVDINRRLTDRLIGTVGVEYGSGEFSGRNVGIRVSLSMLLDNRHRADVNYQSRRDFGRASITRAIENNVGSVGYSLGLLRSFGSTGIEGSADYLGNRLDARLSLSGQGQGLRGLASRRTARLQVGSSIAYAGGTFGIGRPINDSFFLARPTDAIRDADAVLGRSINAGKYEASSGPLGAAVLGQLQSYNTQDVRFDLQGSQAAYDVGTGLARVRPAYRSGYSVVVGNARYVSVIGTLVGEGRPLGLVVGKLESINDEGFAPQQFFTNSAGRFGIMGLAPGRKYALRLNDGRTAIITVPDGAEAVLRIPYVNVGSAAQ